MNATIISIASTKGGCGKTVLSDAIASYLNLLNKKVLLIDMNSQMDLTLEFNLSKKQLKDSCIYRVFQHDAKNPQKPFDKDFGPIHIRKNLDLLTSSADLANVNRLMANNNPSIAPYVLGHLFSSKAGLGLQDKYDYIIIDTHNDHAVPVKNAFIMSDYVLAPVIPSKFGMNSINQTIHVYNTLKSKLVNPITQQSYIHAKLLFIGNLIRFNTKSSNDFMKAFKDNPYFIAFMHELELFNKAQTFGLNIFACAKKEAKDGKKNDLNTLEKRIIPELKKIIRVISK